MDMYVFDGKEYPIEIIRKNNKNTYIRVKNNSVVVTTNYLVSAKKIEKLINDNRDFIDKALSKSIEKMNDVSFKLFGIEYDVVYGFPNTEIDGCKIYSKDEKTFNRFLSKYIYEVYNERLNYWYNVFEENIPSPNLKIRKMTSRWGVCNRRDNSVTLNLELIKMDVKYLDYVIVHELSHFIHFDHSKSFWDTVSKYCKDYKIIRKEMRE